MAEALQKRAVSNGSPVEVFGVTSPIIDSDEEVIRLRAQTDLLLRQALGVRGSHASLLLNSPAKGSPVTVQYAFHGSGPLVHQILAARHHRLFELTKLTEVPPRPLTEFELVRRFEFNEVGSGSWIKSSDPPLLPASKWRLRLDSTIVVSNPFVTTLFKVAQSILDGVQPNYSVAAPAQVEERLRVQHYHSVLDQLVRAGGAVHIQAEEAWLDSDARQYFLKLCSFLPDRSQSNSLFIAIKNNHPVFRICIYVSDAGLGQAFKADTDSQSFEWWRPDLPMLQMSKPISIERRCLDLLSRLYTGAEMVSLLHMPFTRSEMLHIPQRRFLPFGSPQARTATMNDILIGKEVNTDEAVFLDAALLETHMICVGMTKSGKSTTIASTALRLMRDQQWTVCVMDAVKRDVSDLLSKHLTIYDCVQNIPPINLFAAETTEPLQSRCGLITKAILASRPASPLADAEWPLLLQHVYCSVLQDKTGLQSNERTFLSATGDLLEQHAGCIPTFEDLKRYGPDWVQKRVALAAKSTDRVANSVSESASYFLTTLEHLKAVRISLLMEGTRKGSEFFGDNIAICLQAISDRAAKTALMIPLLLALREARKADDLAGRMTQHLTVIDEAHMLIPNNVRSDGTANFRSSAAELAEVMADAVKEMRSFRESMLFADQRASEISQSVIANCGIICVHTTLEANDRAVIQGALCLNEEQSKSLSRLRRGEALIGVAGADPFPVKIEPAMAATSRALLHV